MFRFKCFSGYDTRPELNVGLNILFNLKKLVHRTSVHEKGVRVLQHHPDDRLPGVEEKPPGASLCQEVQILSEKKIIVFLKKGLQPLGLVLLGDDELEAGHDVVVADVSVVQREQAGAG